MLIDPDYAKVLDIMTTTEIKSAIKISPVNMESRKKLGIRAGDTVRVWQKIQEKEKTRLQAFEGLVLARKHGSEAGATFTVRKVASGVGMEKIFPLYSPIIDKIEIIRRAKVRRAKLYYIRDKATKEIRRQMRRSTIVNIQTEDDKKEEQAEQVEQKDEDKVASDSPKATASEGSPKEEIETEEVEKKEKVKEEVK